MAYLPTLDGRAAVVPTGSPSPSSATSPTPAQLKSSGPQKKANVMLRSLPAISKSGGDSSVPAFSFGIKAPQRGIKPTEVENVEDAEQRTSSLRKSSSQIIKPPKPEEEAPPPAPAEVEVKSERPKPQINKFSVSVKAKPAATKKKSSSSSSSKGYSSYSDAEPDEKLVDENNWLRILLEKYMDPAEIDKLIAKLKKDNQGRSAAAIAAKLNKLLTDLLHQHGVVDIKKAIKKEKKLRKAAGKASSSDITKADAELESHNATATSVDLDLPDIVGEFDILDKVNRALKSLVVEWKPVEDLERELRENMIKKRKVQHTITPEDRLNSENNYMRNLLRDHGWSNDEIEARIAAFMENLARNGNRRVHPVDSLLQSLVGAGGSEKFAEEDHELFERRLKEELVILKRVLLANGLNAALVASLLDQYGNAKRAELKERHICERCIVLHASNIRFEKRIARLEKAKEKLQAEIDGQKQVHKRFVREAQWQERDLVSSLEIAGVHDASFSSPLPNRSQSSLGFNPNRSMSPVLGTSAVIQDSTSPDKRRLALLHRKLERAKTEAGFVDLDRTKAHALNQRDALNDLVYVIVRRLDMSASAMKSVVEEMARSEATIQQLIGERNEARRATQALQEEFDGQNLANQERIRGLEVRTRALGLQNELANKQAELTNHEWGRDRERADASESALRSLNLELDRHRKTARSLEEYYVDQIKQLELQLQKGRQTSNGEMLSIRTQELLDEIAHFSEDAQNLRSQLSEANQTIAQLSEQNASEKRTVDSLQTRVQELEDQSLSMTGQSHNVATLQSQVRGLQYDVQYARDVADEVRRDHRLALQNIERLARYLEGEKGLVITLCGEIRKLLETRTALANQIEQLDISSLLNFLAARTLRIEENMDLAPASPFVTQAGWIDAATVRQAARVEIEGMTQIAVPLKMFQRGISSLLSTIRTYAGQEGRLIGVLEDQRNRVTEDTQNINSLLGAQRNLVGSSLRG